MKGLGLAISSLLCLLALYRAVFFAWLTATPLDAEGLSRAQRSCYVWFAVFVASLIFSIVLIVRIVRQR